MTILGLYEYLRKIHAEKNLGEKPKKDFNFECKMMTFSGFRVAIDVSTIMYRYMASARKNILKNADLLFGMPKDSDYNKEWLKFIIGYVMTWLRNDITPIFVMDGKPPDIKAKTSNKRSEDYAERQKKIDKLLQKLDDTKDDILEVDETVINELRTLLSNHVRIGKKERKYLTMSLRSIGLPVITCKVEAEKLCCSLCIDGYATAVVSNDGDCLVHGAPILIKDVNGEKLSGLILDKVLKCLELDHSKFVDFCIICKCDYNERMVGIGPAKGYDLLTKHGTIENIHKEGGKNISNLDHINCRYEFVTLRSEELTEDELQLDIDMEIVREAREMMAQVFSEGKFDEFYKLCKGIKKPKSGLHNGFGAVIIKDYQIKKKKIVITK